jgi:hypothetical protein
MDPTQLALVTSGITLIVAIGGWVVTIVMTRQTKRIERQEKSITHLQKEVRARIALEKAACIWVGELTKGKPQAIKLELRRRTTELSGLRPTLSESSLSTEP